jgi:ABC-2 type transport system ATP-binding protein
MDEAERCHRIGYLFDGKLLVHGPVPEIIANSHLSTWRIISDKPDEVMRALQGRPGVEMVTSFGAQLHVAGADGKALETTLNGLKARYAITAESTPPSLEDIFIHTMTLAGEKKTEADDGKAGPA